MTPAIPLCRLAVISHSCVIPANQATFAALREGGHQVEEGRQLWGERRAKAITPAAHLVAIRADPPPPVVERAALPTHGPPPVRPPC